MAAWPPAGWGPRAAPNASWKSLWAREDASGVLVYRADMKGNRIPDFSYAGYRNGAGLPDVPVAMSIGPVAGDNTNHIQSAINTVSNLDQDANGHRGALLLAPGTYDVRGGLTINASGVVLRGAGDGSDPASNTVIRATGADLAGPAVIDVGVHDPTPWAGRDGNAVDIVSDFVPVGARTFRVSNASGLAVGDNIIIEHPCTQQWLNAVDGGGTGSGPAWAVGELPIRYNRFIMAVDGDLVTIDAPVFNHLNRQHAQSYLYKWNRAGLIAESGVESLRVDIVFSGNGEDETHPRHAIRLGNPAGRMGERLHGFAFLGLWRRDEWRCAVHDRKLSGA
ncbi:hypothetical protein [Phytoactinopolyspora halotolerans]|uniref:Pectate lyase superfamily protein domain-containing protein n=1 Tax=Phytoactinopolyspora halotolerans TaxID=1981512 RepID=A0A6L9SCY8_9ACTN|nr:hypothetical protein [Phytoactinopolyspora halotolerans]NEE02438.1 hypothetical protein [Phytoactinopolyspora halotolerans]